MYYTLHSKPQKRDSEPESPIGGIPPFGPMRDRCFDHSSGFAWSETGWEQTGWLVGEESRGAGIQTLLLTEGTRSEPLKWSSAWGHGREAAPKASARAKNAAPKRPVRRVPPQDSGLGGPMSWFRRAEALGVPFCSEPRDGFNSKGCFEVLFLTCCQSSSDSLCW